MKWDSAKILRAFGPFGAFALVWACFGVLESWLQGTPFVKAAIFSGEAVVNIIQNTAVVGVAAIGMTLIIVAAGIDLSVGSAISFCSVVAAKVIAAGGAPHFVIMAALGTGLACGLLNGLLIVFARLIPFITTLGTLLVLRGLSLGLADSQPINVQEAAWLRWWLLPPASGFALLPPGGWLMLSLAALTVLVLHYTVFGRHVFAVGSNESTARLCGVAVDRVKLEVYAIAGVLSGAAGLMLCSFQGQGDPTGAEGYELDVIAAVVIGGASLSGGVGSVFGSMIGALIMTVIRTGCTLNGVSLGATKVVTGTIIVAAVLADRIRQRSARS